MTADPIGPEEAAKLFECLDRPIAVAVSGGVDSIVLMHLIAEWWPSHRAVASTPPLVLSIDHGLRAASLDETRFVAAQANSLGLRHETLTWTGPKPATGVQAAARKARYDLILNRLAGLEPRPDLLLAHHLDDQAETFLMRLARGSGLDGLSAMRSSEIRFVTCPGPPMHDGIIRLFRPLLGVAKARLMATAKARSLTWRHDPSNDNLEFERVRIRQQAATLDACGLKSEGIARSAWRLAAERSAALARVRQIARASLTHHDGAYGELELSQGRDVERSDLVRLLSQVLGVYGGASPPAQLSQIEHLADELNGLRRSGWQRLTLGGCLVEWAGHVGGKTSMRVFREAGRLTAAPCRVEPGQGVFWDDRFYVNLAKEAAGPMDIMPLDAESEVPSLPRAAAACLPAVATPDGRRCVFRPGVEHVTCSWPERHLYNLGLKDAVP